MKNRLSVAADAVAGKAKNKAVVVVDDDAADELNDGDEMVVVVQLCYYWNSLTDQTLNAELNVAAAVAGAGSTGSQILGKVGSKNPDKHYTVGYNPSSSFSSFLFTLSFQKLFTLLWREFSHKVNFYDHAAGRDHLHSTDICNKAMHATCCCT